MDDGVVAMEESVKNSWKSLKGIKSKKTISKWIYEFFDTYNKQNYVGSARVWLQKLKFSIENLVNCLQICSLLWVSNLEVSKWNEIIGILKLIGYVRFDNLCSALNVYETCFYSIFAINIITIFGVLILGFLLKFKFSSSKLSIPVGLCKIILNLFSETFFIPAIVLLCMYFKYNITNDDTIIEYFDNNQSSNLRLNSYLWVVSPGIMIISLLIVFVARVYSADIRHKYSYINVYAKSHSNPEIMSLAYEFLISIIYAVIGADHYWYFRLIVIWMSLILFYNYLKISPYYNDISNSIAALKYLIIAIVSVIFIIGSLIDDAYTIMTLSIVLVPLFAIIHLWKRKRIRKRNKIAIFNVNYFKNIFQLEKVIRGSLISKKYQNFEQMTEIFADCYVKSSLWKNKLLVIWEANYCFYSLKNISLARIKLCKASQSLSSFEADFQEYICQKRCNLHRVFSDDEFSYPLYSKNLESAKNDDEKFCDIFLEFIRQISTEVPKLEILYTCIHELNNKIEEINHKYAAITIEFSKCSEPFVFYSTFLQLLGTDNEKSAILLRKWDYLVNNLNKAANPTEKLNYFDEYGGVLLISCNKNSLGVIKYATPKVCEFLNAELYQILGNNFSYFIPPPYDQIITHGLQEYVQYQSMTEIYLPQSICLKNSYGWLTECYARAVIVAVNCNIYIMVALKSVQSSYHFALVADNGQLTAYSKNFNEIFGMKSNLESINLNSVFPSYEIMEIFSPEKINFNDKNWFVMKGSEMFIDTKIHYILVDKSEVSIKNWINDRQINLYDNETCKIPNAFLLENTRSMEFLGLSMSIFDYKSMKQDRLSTFNDTTIVETDEEIKENNYFQKYEKSLTSPNYSSDSASIKATNQIVETSIKQIKLFNYIIMLSIAAVIITTIVLVSFVVIETNRANDLDTLMLIGNLELTIINIATYSRSVDNVYTLAQYLTLQTYISNLEQNLKSLKEIKAEILGNLTSWDTCNLNEIFTSSVVPIWNVKENYTLEYRNMIDIMDDFLEIGNEFLTNVANNQSYIEELNFLVLNGFGHLYEYTDNAVSYITNCTNDNVENLSDQINALYHFQIGVLVVCVGCLLFFAKSLESKIHNFWIFIRKSTIESFQELSEGYINRLAQIHDKTYYKEEDRIIENPKSLNFKSYKRFWWRIILYFAISVIFTFVTQFKLYTDCNWYLEKRPQIINAMQNEQMAVLKLYFWSKEVIIEYYDPLYKKFGIYDLKMPKYELKDSLIKILYESKRIRQRDYVEMYGSQSVQLLFESTTSQSGYFQIGIFSSVYILLFEGLYIGYSFDPDTVAIMVQMHSNVRKFEWWYKQLLSFSDTETKRLVDEQLNLIIWVGIVYSLSLIILYSLAFAPFLWKEKQKIHQMFSISKIIPKKPKNALTE
ncbi:unnamed protein product [Blepharisma stoltei]|uniref:PAS domain-containing protein n=1 Tax=Blepharisma stoltei TaxID=1481888 RepID=A0AAU9K5D6_9CILI|nr:unnamed protein product [Blepharisma stoltei]